MNIQNKITKQELMNYVQSKQIKKNIPEFGSGDVIVVHNKIKENNKIRVQKFEGVVIRRRGSGISETMIVRKESSGIGRLCSFRLP